MHGDAGEVIAPENRAVPAYRRPLHNRLALDIQFHKP